MDTSRKLRQIKNLAMNSAIVACTRCDRLRQHCQDVAQTKRKAYCGQTYWGKPVPGFGDLAADLWVLGLAPGAHGANRTGRVFTGDRSGEWLYRVLFERGWSSHPVSEAPDDGLHLSSVYISCIVRCAPPDNRPNPSEIDACRGFLEQELQALHNLRVVLCLGAIAYQQACRLLSVTRPPKFSHGLELIAPCGRTVLCSYHPSQQNTFTGRLKWSAWSAVFERAQALVAEKS